MFRGPLQARNDELEAFTLPGCWPEALAVRSGWRGCNRAIHSGESRRRGRTGNRQRFCPFRPDRDRGMIPAALFEARRMEVVAVKKMMIGLRKIDPSPILPLRQKPTAKASSQQLGR